MAQARRKYLEKDSKICGRYVLRKLLKTEPIGITYGAVDQLNRRKVAIFEYFPQGMTERDHIFCNQVRVIDYNKSQVYYQGKHAIVECALTMMKYHHEKGIISVLEYMEMNNTVYIVYEYEKGVSLADYVSSKGPFPEAEFITKMEPVIEAVKELHKSGLAHGNITPDTLKVTETGSIMINDFGGILQKLLPESLSYGMPGYSITPSNDISMLAECIYFGLSGVRPPVRRERERGIRPRDLDTYEMPVSRYVADAVSRAMSAERGGGYSSVKEFSAHLHNSVYVKSDKEKKAAPPPPVPRPLPASQPRKPAGTLQEMLENLEKQKKEQERNKKNRKKTTSPNEKKQTRKKEKKPGRARPLRLLIMIYVFYFIISMLRTAGGCHMPHITRPDLPGKKYTYTDHQAKTQKSFIELNIDGEPYTMPADLQEFVTKGWIVYEGDPRDNKQYDFGPLKKEEITSLVLTRNDQNINLEYYSKESGMYAISSQPYSMAIYSPEENMVSLGDLDLYDISKRQLENYLDVDVKPDDYAVYTDPYGISMTAFYTDGRLSFVTFSFRDFNSGSPAGTDNQEL
ncbi:MAG: protein kinase [Eubacterium sp.]|nr:protein kinase [Eubacterium sp.]